MSRVGRILWNRRPTSVRDGGDIDEIVIHDATVHVEQMDDNWWWIGVTRADGTYWFGNFTSNGPMRFSQQENAGIEWDSDQTHEIEDRS